MLVKFNYSLESVPDLHNNIVYGSKVSPLNTLFDEDDKICIAVPVFVYMVQKVTLRFEYSVGENNDEKIFIAASLNGNLICDRMTRCDVIRYSIII